MKRSQKAEIARLRRELRLMTASASNLGMQALTVQGERDNAREALADLQKQVVQLRCDNARLLGLYAGYRNRVLDQDKHASVTAALIEAQVDD